MNRRMNETYAQNQSPWKNWHQLPKPEGKNVILHTAVLLIATVVLPLYSNVWISLTAWILLSLAAFAICGKSFLGAVLSVAASAVLTILSPSLGALFLGIVLSVLCGAYLMTAGRKFYLPLIISVISFGISFAVSGDWKLSLLAFFPLPAEILLAVATRLGEYRTTAICYGIGGLLLSLIVLLLVLLYQKVGSINLGAVKDLLHSAQEEGLKQLQNLRDQMIAGTPGADATAMGKYLTDDALSDYVLYFSYLLPALGVVACSVCAFLSQKMLNAAYLNSGMRVVLTPETEFFTMSVPAAVIFTVAFLLSSFLSPVQVSGAVVMSLVLILLPGMCVIGVRMLYSRFRHSHTGRDFAVFAAVALFGCCSGQLLYLLGLYGAYGRVSVAVRAKLRKFESGDSDYRE